MSCLTRNVCKVTTFWRTFNLNLCYFCFWVCIVLQRKNNSSHQLKVMTIKSWRELYIRLTCYFIWNTQVANGHLKKGCKQIPLQLCSLYCHYFQVHYFTDCLKTDLIRGTRMLVQDFLYLYFLIYFSTRRHESSLYMYRIKRRELGLTTSSKCLLFQTEIFNNYSTGARWMRHGN